MGNKSSANLSPGDIKNLSDKTSFDRDQLEALRAAFIAADKDKSGELDRKEFKAMITKYLGNVTPKMQDGLFDLFDADGSGTVSFSEVALALSLISSGEPKKRLEYIFSLFDKNGDGTLDKAEIEQVVERMFDVAAAMGRGNNQTKDFIKGVIVKLDASGDGVITKQEWVDKGSSTPSLLTLLGMDKTSS